MTKKISAVLFLLLLCSAAHAEEPAVERPVLSAYAIEAGSSHITETYLSPLHHSGTALAFSYERMQAMRFDPKRWVMRLDMRLSGARTLNQPARNAYLWDMSIRAGWSMLRRFRPAGNWTVFAGGSTDIEGGAFYLPRNSNNPVAAKASWTVNLAAGAAWNHRFGKVPVCFRYLAEMPLTGIFFSPQYGELYYEIYLGNHKDLVRGAWWGNFFRLDNLLTADIRLGRTIIRAGYRCDILSTKASHIVTRRIEHMAVLGIASEWISLSADRRGPSRECRIISALY
ncbi:MAG: DUF3316 domain-containing protein [Muribaculaceae bacterium]|nr:DUF3316 domain-containing protein [Muribaculaceae bacterium]